MPDEPLTGSARETAENAVAWRTLIRDIQILLARLPKTLDDYATAIRSSASSQAASSVIHVMEQTVAQRHAQDQMREDIADIKMLLQDIRPRIEMLEASHTRRDIQIADILIELQRLQQGDGI